MKGVTRKELLDIEEMTKLYNQLGAFLKASSIASAYEKDFTNADFVTKNPYTEFISNIIDVNRCFIKCLPIEELLVLKALVRTQLQNCIWLYAEYLQPLNILDRIYNKGKQLNQLPIRQPEIIEKLKELYPKIPISDIWLDTCKFVHPTALNWEYSNYLANIRTIEAEYLNDETKKLIRKLGKGLSHKIPFKKIAKPDIDNLININKT